MPSRFAPSNLGDDVVLAASMFIHTPNELVPSPPALSEFNSLYGIDRIHRRMLEWSVENKVKWYNFWGIAKDFSPEGDAGGVLKFKRHFNGDVEEYLGTYDAPIRPVLAKLLWERFGPESGSGGWFLSECAGDEGVRLSEWRNVKGGAGGSVSWAAHPPQRA